MFVPSTASRASFDLPAPRPGSADAHRRLHAHASPAFLDALAGSTRLGPRAPGPGGAEVAVDGREPVRVPAGLDDEPGRVAAMDAAV